MSRSLVGVRKRGVPRIAVAVLAAAGLVVSVAPAASAQPVAAPAAAGEGSTAGPSQFTAGRYIVTLQKAPIAAYEGGVAKIPATKPTAGRKVQVQSAAARRYQQVLSHDQASVAASVGAKPTSHYSVALNGFAAELTAKQAQKLAATPGVVAVTKDALQTIQDDRVDYDYWKLAGSTGVWDSLGGIAKAGKGVVIGVIDTGIWPEAASFAGAKLGTQPSASDPYRAYRVGDQIVQKKANGDTFTGACEVGENWTANLCNTKLISARYFGDSFLAANPVNLLVPDESVSPRDGDGHGTHTASTAGGNYGVTATVEGRNFGKISGVAPGASIAAYKVLWDCVSPCTSGGLDSDIVSAVDQAVTDGVDVINYSVGGTSESGPGDPVQLAFLTAASAGIFVSAAGGNSGPGASTLDNTSPWITTVAASTMKPYEGTVVLGNGKKYVGASTTVTATVGPKPLIAGQSAAAAGQTTAVAALCGPNSLDPAKVAGKIVECDRGVYDRVAKSAEVKRAGGAGMILANLASNSTDADLHSVPTVHIDVPGGPEVKAYALTAGATASLVPGNTTGIKTAYPQIAAFSSRGPSLASAGNLLKPDVSAPGVGVLAATAPVEEQQGRSFNFLSGTSMATPHIAGLAALYKAKNPTWGPMAIKSALMTTARNTRAADGSGVTDPFAQGAGEAVPTRMFNPGLIYNSGDDDWLGYLEGLGYDTGTGAPAIDPSDYNTPSIAIGALLGSQKITRRVTAVTPGLYRAQISVPGFTAKVTPSILTFSKAGQTRPFTVTLTRTTAKVGKYATGFLTWTGNNNTVRSPIAIQPVAVRNTTPEVSVTGTAGSASWTVQSGVSGAFPIQAFGLARAKVTAGSVAADGENTYPLTVAAGTKVVRFAAVGPDDSSGADIDLYVYRIVNGAATLVGVSGTSSAREAVTLVAPAAGDYIAAVDGFANAPGTTSTAYQFRSYAVGTTGNTGTFTVSPANSTVRVQQSVPVTASFSGASTSTPALGWVQYLDGSGTIVKVNASGE
ncbi:S8 family peptidase [Nakamurella endophytica]|uniref:Serine protease n=1 Tax=Nakamurella endophytica TaxID=1748367 RepID=A0A917SNP1_9ACTN|nr:S8 family peptidase [Nakamurella endophytica]GGL89945.1 hypothetical protein GCM10011594_07010 [Nakamurella endophytica]